MHLGTVQRSPRPVLVRVVGLICCVLLATLFGSGPASAGISAGATSQPRPSRPVLEAEQQTLALEQLGADSSVALPGLLGEQRLFLDLPEGLTPTSLSGRLSLSPDIRSASLSLYVDDRLADVQALDRHQHGQEVELTLPADLRTIVAGRSGTTETIEVTLRSSVEGPDDVCTATAVGTQVALDDIVIGIDGTPTPPSTLESFFGPVVEQVSLVTGPEPDRRAAEVAVVLAAGLAHRYGTAVPALRVSDQRVAPDGDYDRVLVMDDRPQGLDLDDDDPRIMTIGRRAAAAQVEVLLGPLSPLVPVDSAAVVQLDQPDRVDVTSRSLSQLGVDDLQTSGVGVMDIDIAVSQPALGGPAGDLVVRLAGTHTPVAQGQASLSILVDELQLATEALEDGHFDAVVAVPDVVSKREFTLKARFVYAPEGGVCALGSAPFTAQIDPRSSLQFSAEQVLPPGFERFPQNVVDDLPVHLDDSGPDSVQVAVDVVAGLQSLSEVPLRPRVVTAIPDDENVVVASGDLAMAGRLAAPLRDGGTRVVGRDGQTVLEVTAAASSSLQAFEAQGRDILLAVGPEVDEVVGRVAGSPDGWFGLRGDTAILIGGGVTSIRLVDGPVVPETLDPGPRGWVARNRPLVFLAALVVLVLGLAAIYPRVVRPGPAADEVETEAADGRVDGPAPAAGHAARG